MPGFLGEVADRFGDDLGGSSWPAPAGPIRLALVLADRYTAASGWCWSAMPRAASIRSPARAGTWPCATSRRWPRSWSTGCASGSIPAMRVALERYAAWRRFDGLALVAVTDGINRLFANDLLPVRLAREAGLAAVQRIAAAEALLHAARDGPGRRSAAGHARAAALTARKRRALGRARQVVREER